MVGVESKLQLPTYTTVTARQDPSRICNLHHGSQQHWILNPLSKVRDPTHTLTETTLGSEPAEPQWELSLYSTCVCGVR